MRGWQISSFAAHIWLLMDFWSELSMWGYAIFFVNHVNLLLGLSKVLLLIIYPLCHTCHIHYTGSENFCQFVHVYNGKGGFQAYGHSHPSHFHPWIDSPGLTFSLNTELWCSELANDQGKHFLVDVICNGFQPLSKDSSLMQVEMQGFYQSFFTAVIWW